MMILYYLYSNNETRHVKDVKTYHIAIGPYNDSRIGHPVLISSSLRTPISYFYCGFATTAGDFEIKLL